MWVINPAVGCHYFPPGLQLPPQPLRGLLPVLLVSEQRHTACDGRTHGQKIRRVISSCCWLATKKTKHGRFQQIEQELGWTQPFRNMSDSRRLLRKLAQFQRAYLTKLVRRRCRQQSKRVCCYFRDSRRWLLELMKQSDDVTCRQTSADQRALQQRFAVSERQ